MFDDMSIDKFKYYEEYGKLIRCKLEELYEDFTEEELIHKCKCVLGMIQMLRPTLKNYYIKGYLNDSIHIYTKWAKHSELTTLDYLVLNDKLVVNKNTLTEITYTNCTTTNANEVLKIISDSFRTLIGYENENNSISDAPLVIR